MKGLLKCIVFLLLVGVIGFTVVQYKGADNIKSYFQMPDKKEQEQKYVRTLRQAMLDREQKVSLKFYGSSSDAEEFAEDALEKAFQIQDKNSSSDYDYLKANFKSMNAKIKGLGRWFFVEYNFTYRETKEQSDKVDKTVKSILKKKKIKKMKPYKKVRTIHDFIVENASYDITYKNDSAYDNLILKSSVCHGYAVLAYKMLKEAGIPCRIITGESRGEGHAWNIVKLGKKWYNLDCTWDDPVTPDGSQATQYTYFLKCFDDFPEHKRDKEYDMPSFNKKYPMAEKSYPLK